MPCGAKEAGGVQRPRHTQQSLIKQVYEVNPLRFARCGAELKIIGFIEQHQTDVIEEHLRHCGLWDQPSARATPMAKLSVTG